MADIRGTTGNDTLTGTSGADRINADRGNDVIDGGGGNDAIDAGDGADVITGGAGDDTVRGGAGIDLFKFQAGDGKDTISDLAAGETVEIHGYSSAQSITQVGGSVVLVLSGGDQITFQNANVATVQAALHFVDAPPVDPMVGDFADAKFSSDGSRLYAVSGNTITVIDTANGTAITHYTIGIDLGGFDLSSDGHYLAVVEADPGSSTGKVFRIDLTNGAITTYSTPISSGAFFDVAFLSDGTALISQQGIGNTSTPLRVLNFASGTFSAGSQSFGGATLSASADHTHVVMEAPNFFQASYMYVAGQGVTGQATPILDPYAGAALPPPGSGIHAISPAGDLNVQGVNLNVYDSSMNLQLSLATKFPYLGAQALAFSPDGQKLYVAVDHDVLVFSTSTWDAIGAYSIDSNVANARDQISGAVVGYGDILQASADGHYLSVITDEGIELIDLTQATFESTTGADTLSGGGALFGLAGDDVLSGNGVGSWMYGGTGDDTYYVTSYYDHLTELANEGHDTIHSTVPYQLMANEEDLVLDSTANISGFGNELNNALTGNEAANFLSGAGGNDHLSGGGGDDTLDGGAGNDTLTGGAGADKFVYAYSGGQDVITDLASGETVQVDGYGLAQSITQVGGDVVVILSATDQLTFQNCDVATVQSALQFGSPTGVIDGGPGDDSLHGSPGNDTIAGHAGSDTLTGGGGNDRFLFAAGDGHDVITDFIAGDIVEINGYGAVNSASQVGADVVLVISAGDQITFLNTDVATVQAGIELATINDTVIGTPGNDILNGFRGDDIVIGRGGADTLNGGDGNDVLFSAEWSGNATLFTTDSGAEHDVLVGGEGGDVLNIGYGDDADGGSGFDQLWLSLEAATAGVTINTAAIVAGQTVTIAGGTIQNMEAVEYLRGSSFADNITFATQNYYIGIPYVYAGGGDDVITSQGSRIWAYGETGNDRFISGSDPDVFDGGDGIDTVDYGNAAGGVSVSLSNGYSSALDLLLNIENVDGSALSDTLVGDSGNNVLRGLGGFDLLQGGAGNDTLEGGVGVDLLDGGSGNDTMKGGADDDFYYVDSALDVVVELAGGGDGDTVNTTITYTLGANFERGFATGTAAINLTGNELNNELVGNTAANVVVGGAGDDVLYGGDGNDTLDGGTGSDTLQGDAGVDTFIYRIGSGLDSIADLAAGENVNVYGYTAAQSIVQTNDFITVTFAPGEQLFVYFTTVAAVTAALHFIPNGGGTPGTITGTASNDTLNGTSGNDTINGLAGNDTLNGSGGNDTLDGGAGADTMKGGAGNDIYYVDSASDLVTELAAQGTDEVRSTISYALGTNVEKLTALGSAAINLTGNSAANTLTGNDAANVLYGMSGNDTLLGGGGNDTLRGGLGTDTLTGGAGADFFLFEKGGGNDRVTDFVSATDKIDLHLLGITSADVKTTLSGSNTIVSVDADHNGTSDFTITLTGVAHVNAADYIF